MLRASRAAVLQPCFGAVRTWASQVAEQKEDLFFCIVDAHAITQEYEPAELRRRIASMALDLVACGLDPAYVVGGELRGTGSNAGWGDGDWIVVEADESDRSLLQLHPDIAVLTNAELDHHSTYRSMHDLEDTFRTFMSRAAPGCAVVWDRPALRALCKTASSRSSQALEE